MIRREWKDYVGTDAAERVAAHAHDLMEYLHGLLKQGELDTAFEKEMGRIGYHVPCHLKVQKIGFRSRDVLKKIPGHDRAPRRPVLLHGRDLGHEEGLLRALETRGRRSSSTISGRTRLSACRAIA